MSLIPAVQWHEGMLLVPQHLQQLSRRFEQMLNLHMVNQNPNYWGVMKLVVSDHLLAQGVYRVDEFLGVFPDGLVAEKGEKDTLQIDLNPHKNDLIQSYKTLYILVPVTPAGHSPVLGETPRYYSTMQIGVEDENIQGRFNDIPTIVPKLSLMLANLPPDGYSAIPIAKIGYRDQTFVLEKFLLPCMQITADHPLRKKLTDFAGELRLQTQVFSEKCANQIGSPLWIETAQLLRPLIRVLPILEGLLQTPKFHPYQLFLALNQAVGELGVLRLEQLMPMFPAYQHHDLETTFQPFWQWLYMVLRSLEHSYVVLEFKDEKRIFSLNIANDYLKNDLLIGFHAPRSMSESELRDWVTDAMVCSRSFMDSVRIKRITGATREIVQDEALVDLLPGRNLLLYRVIAGSQFLKGDEELCIFNLADQEKKRPDKIVLYVNRSRIGNEST